MPDLTDNKGLARLVDLLPVTEIAGAADVEGEAVTGLAGYARAVLSLTVSAVNDDADDTLDVYVDVSPDDGDTWINAVHFDQFLGNGSGGKRVAVLAPGATPPETDQDVSSDAAAGVVRPWLWGSQMRVRYVVVDPSGDDAEFTVVVAALFQR